MLFKTKIHLAVSSDELRPVMGYIFFQNGYAYATDAHIAVKQHLGYCFEATEEEVKMLDGMYIDAISYKFLFNRPIIIKQSPVEEGKPKRVFVQTVYGRLKHSIELHNSQEAGRFPNIEAVIPKGADECIASNICSFNAKIFRVALECCLYSDSFKTFTTYQTKEDRAVKIICHDIPEDKQVIIIMPVRVPQI